MNPTTAQIWDGRPVSVARQMSEALTEIEDLFGPRDTSFTFVGIEFFGQNPQIFFLATGHQHILIGLSLAASEYWNTAVHELAHECVHLLSPAPGSPAINLEEGLATWYAEHFYRRIVRRDPGPVSKFYIEAYTAVTEFLAAAPDGPCVIRRLRDTEPHFSQITAEQMLAAAPALNPETASFLAGQWSRLPDESSTPAQ